MGKLIFYLLMMTGMTLLFYFGGLLENTVTSTLLDIALKPENLQNASPYTQVIIVLELIISAGIIMVGIGTSNVEIVIVGPLAIYFLNLGWDFISVFNIVRAENEFLAVLLFSPFVLIYLVTVVEWWRGRD